MSTDDREYRNSRGLFHREDGPARIIRMTQDRVREEWWYDGALHRLDGPAITVYDKDSNVLTEQWWYMSRYCSDPMEHLLVRHQMQKMFS